MIIFELRDRRGIESQTAESFLSPHRQFWKRFSQSASGPFFGVLYHFGFSQCVFKLRVTPGSLPDWHSSPRHSDRPASEEEWNQGLVRVTPHGEPRAGSEGVMRSWGRHFSRVLLGTQIRKPEKVGWAWQGFVITCTALSSKPPTLLLTRLDRCLQAIPPEP